jgi:uncharacterized membrane protein YphA (DoxX/SURF4 family)
MKTLSLAGRMLFGLCLLAFSVNPLLHARQTAEAMPLPAAQLLIAYGAGIILLAGGLSLLTGKWMQPALLLVACVMFVRAFTSHLPNMDEPDYAVKMLQIMNMTKDIALAGAALFIAGHSSGKH